MELGLFWLKKGAEADDHLSQYILGGLYLTGYNKVGKGVKKALYWIKRSAENGNEKAKMILKKMQEIQQQNN